MRRLAVVTLLVGVLLMAEAAHGFNGGYGGGVWGGYYAPSYYGSYPVWTYPIYGAGTCHPVGSSYIVPLTPIPFATPKSAPPSKTKEPPLGKTKEPPLGKTTEPPVEDKAPKIVESRSPSVTQVAAKDKCKVGFWNLTGKNVEISVAGKTHTLPKDRALTLELARSFSWNIEGQSPTQESVAADRAFHEIILRSESR